MPSLSDDQLVRLAKILRRNRLVQMPCNIHWLAAGVLHIGCCSKTGIRCSTNAILLELPHEENDLAAALPVVDITLTGACRIGGRALTLPMEQAFVDRIVVVHGSRGVVLVRFYCTLNREENQTIYQRPPLNLYVFHKFANSQAMFSWPKSAKTLLSGNRTTCLLGYSQTLIDHHFVMAARFFETLKKNGLGSSAMTAARAVPLSVVNAFVLLCDVPVPPLSALPHKGK